MIWIIPLVGLIIFELIADIFAKEYSLKNNSALWLGAVLSYVIANVFWLYAIKNGSGLARGAIIFSVSSAVIATVLGLYFYHEKMTGYQTAGIILGLTSLILIFWEA